jgi:SNF2 family DNA or RNA helicase
MASKKNTDYHLLIRPAEILKQSYFLGILAIYKTSAKTDYQLHEPESYLLKYLPGALIKHVTPLLPENINHQLSSAYFNHPRLRTGVSQETFVRRHYLKYCQLHFRMLAESSGIHKFYHRVSSGTGKGFKTSPCIIHHLPVTLSFEVVKDKKGLLSVLPLFHVSGEQLVPSTYKRYGFLLLVENNYYILSHTDTMMLDWLEERNALQYARNPAMLSKAIISRLEEKYTVNRNNHFPVTEIACKPENVLLLSEINNNFLVLTPQWRYDDILVEGVFKPRHELQIQGEIYVIQRDKEAEQAFTNYLKSLHPSFGRQINGYYYLSFDEAKKKNWFLNAFHQWLEKDIQLSGMDMLSHFRYSTYPIATEFRLVREEEKTLEFFMKVTFGKEEVSLTELKKLLISRQQYVLLKDNSMGVLTEEWISTYSLFIKHGKIIQNTIVIPSWILLSIGERDNEQTEWQLAFSSEWWNKWLQWQDASNQIVPVPSSLNAQLRPYQHKGFEWMSLLTEIGGGALLADDMGLGKTLQAITLMLHLKEKSENERFLIIAPASLMVNWQKELEKFAPELNTYIFHQQNKNLEQLYEGNVQVVITSYGTARSAIEELSIIHWNLVVLDESHHIKNTGTLTAKAITQLSSNARIALSGTPLMNNTEELYSQINFLLPGLLGTLEFFRKEYANPIDREQDPVKTKALQKITQPFILRRTKQQVATDLPEKIESVIWCTMSNEQSTCYAKEADAIKGSIYREIKDKGFQQSKMNILTGIMRLRQICSSPSIVKNLEYPTTESIKFDLLMEEIRSLGEHKALIFSQFKEVLHQLAGKCEEEGILYYRFDGETPPAERHQLVEAFQEDGNPVQILLMSLMTGNAGFNLTKADYVFLVDPWWNKAVLDQAIDRTHRIGQDKTVFAYKMICKNTIEERILQLQQRKQSISDELISEESGFVKQLTEEDVQFLFS